jgi:hypothetical protein
VQEAVDPVRKLVEPLAPGRNINAANSLLHASALTRPHLWNQRITGPKRHFAQMAPCSLGHPAAACYRNQRRNQALRALRGDSGVQLVGLIHSDCVQSGAAMLVSSVKRHKGK